MDELTNPFLLDESKLNIPKFPKKRTFTITLSDEAIYNLERTLTRYNLPMSYSGISRLLESIGVLALNVTIPTTITDEESGITTEDCRISGFEDAMEGNPQRFIQLFGNMNTDAFQDSYIRGYLEGNYVKNKMR